MYINHVFVCTTLKGLPCKCVHMCIYGKDGESLTIGRMANVHSLISSICSNCIRLKDGT